MRARSITVALSALALGGCSYEYGILATVRDGRIIFVVDPESSNAPSCVRRVEVSAAGARDSAWRESVDYDDACANKFPIAYGVKFKGRSQPEWPEIPATSLQRGITYVVSSTTGAIGYGVGRFSIGDDGRVVNEQRLPKATSSSR